MDLIEEKMMSGRSILKMKVEKELIPFLRENLDRRDKVTVREKDLRIALGKTDENKLKSNSFYAIIKREFGKGRNIGVITGNHVDTGERLYSFFYKENDGKK